MQINFNCAVSKSARSREQPCGTRRSFSQSERTEHFAPGAERVLQADRDAGETTGGGMAMRSIQHHLAR